MEGGRRAENVDGTEGRLMSLFLAHVACMALVGVVATIAVLVSIGFPLDVPQLGIGLLLGAGVGGVSSIFVVPCVFRRDLRWAVPIVYIPTGVLVVVYMCVSWTAYWPFDGIVVAFVAVCVFGIVALVLCPRFRFTMPGYCPECEFDLRGQKETGCPECGWLREKFPEQSTR
jgi:hypothetical protein